MDERVRAAVGAGGRTAGAGVVAGEGRGGYDAAAGGDDGAGSVPDEVELARLIDDVRAAEAHVAAAVVRAGRLAGSGVAERVEGQSLERVLGSACRLTGADRKTLIAAGEALADMPVVRQHFLDGVLSWGQVRAITAEVKRRSRADRQWLDERLAATAVGHGGLGRFEPDELVEAARVACAELDAASDAERRDAEGIRESFLSLQPDLFGGARAYGEWDPVTAATILNAVEQAAGPPRPQPDGDGGDGDGDGDDANGEGGIWKPATRSGWSPTGRGRQYVEGLARLCAEWLAGNSQPSSRGATDDTDGGDDAEAGAGGGGSRGAGGGVAEGVASPVTGRQARPRCTVLVDLRQATLTSAGTVDVPVHGTLPRLSAAAVEALACDADVRAVLVDGARPLAAANKTTASTVPSETRAAVEARDGGCRWDGCQAPPAHTEIHHLTPQAVGGTHHPDELVSLCRADHVTGHGGGWSLRLDPDTGALHASHRGQHKWTTLPRGTPLTQLPDASACGGDRDPPDRDPPDDAPPEVDAHGDPLPF